jgi:hypothetical protein
MIESTPLLVLRAEGGEIAAARRRSQWEGWGSFSSDLRFAAGQSFAVSRDGPNWGVQAAAVCTRASSSIDCSVSCGPWNLDPATY